ncbi:hypothetical protein HMPREF1531_01577 [Propionibacterium sp. oral taxon 192 str. F0372]|uniref:helix-turn-helix domain-containing protein n=1 Tax=Propionibacterium sp. oral taxon 192 TaxID=671222 RepID=UPI0003538049|nr:XRE family transcriptional regulator [Propionibacterium sp. oral taxon 192]EPH02271.1 hypothetical protein HMPREF1531_01577 [Propionibacterium sp. oral taxon 192 str. F0372]
MDNVDLGRRIHEARTAKQWNQSQLAQALGMDRTTLAKIEAGQRKVSALDLIALSRELDRRIDWFLSAPSPAIAQHRGASEEELLLLPIDHHLDLLERNVRFLSDLGALRVAARPQVLRRPGNSDESEELGQKVRKLARLGKEDPVTDLVEVCEKLGLLVFARNLGGDDADAASVVDAGHGVALVNSDRAVGRRRLSAAHELMHHMVDDRYQNDFMIYDHASQHEIRIDHAARAFLLPADPVHKMWQKYFEEDGTRSAAVRTASAFRVDMTTLASRLLELGHISADTADDIRDVRTRKGDIMQFGLVVPHDMEETVSPPSYEMAVIKAYLSEDITADRAVDLLEGRLTTEDLPPRPTLDPSTLWSVLQ